MVSNECKISNLKVNYRENRIYNFVHLVIIGLLLLLSLKSIQFIFNMNNRVYKRECTYDNISIFK